MLLRTLTAGVFAVLLSTASVLLVSCEKKKAPEPEPTVGKLGFEFENVVGSQPLTFGTTYTSTAGEQFTVSKFNYIISNIKLRKADGTEWAEPESYHLVKQADAGSRRFTVQGIPPGDYSKVTFTIGVDSVRNTDGAQTGALDIGNDMYWNWTTGYIFLKLEGTSPQSRTNQLSYHIGGFRRPNNTIRTVSPALPAGTVTLKVGAEQTPELRLKADVLRMFAGPNDIRFSQLPATGHSSDPNSVRLADNYAAGMFRIDHVH